jgi:hypothetical protein
MGKGVRAMMGGARRRPRIPPLIRVSRLCLLEHSVEAGGISMTYASPKPAEPEPKRV